MKDKIFCSKCNSISNYDPYFKKYICSKCGHMEKDNSMKTGIVLRREEKGDFVFFVIQDSETLERYLHYIDKNVVDRTIVLYDVVEYETEGDEIKHIERKYNLLLDEIMMKGR